MMETRDLLKDQAYRTLKQMLLDGVYLPGTFLSERQLVDALGMSKTPIRTALERLEHDGFVSISPQQGIIVCELVSNAYQHAFPHATGGHIDIGLQQVEGGLYRLLVKNNGKGLPTDYREGSGKLGERALAIMGIRDPITLSYLDDVIAFARRKVEDRFGPAGQPGGYELFYHVFGRNGVMGYLEPVTEITSHEIGIVVEAVAPSRAMADEIAAMGSRNMFYARLPEVKGTAGGASFFSDEILQARPGYEWTINHVVPVNDPRSLFRTRHLTLG